MIESINPSLLMSVMSTPALPTRCGLFVDNTGGLWACDAEGGRRLRDSRGAWNADAPRMDRHAMRLFAPFHPACGADIRA